MTRIFPAFLAIFLAASHAFAAEKKIDFANKVAEENSCGLLLPIQSQNADSSNRIGALISVKQLYLGPVPEGGGMRPTIWTRDTGNYWCSPSTAYSLPNQQGYQDGTDIKDQEVIKDMGAGLEVSFGEFLKVLNLSAENISAVSFEVSNSKSYEYSWGNQKRAIRSLVANKDDCKEALAEPTSRLIYRICTGEVTLGVYLKTAVTGTVLNIALGQLKIGGNFRYRYEAKSVADCATTPAIGTKGTDAKSGAKAGNAADKGASTPPAQSSTTTKPGVKIDASLSTDQLSLKVEKAPDSKKASDANAKAATDDQQKEIKPEKCYSYAKVVSKPDAVFGVNLTPLTGKLSVKALIKAAGQ